MLTVSLGIVSIVMFWGMLELGIAVIAICLPVLYRLRLYWSPADLVPFLRSSKRSNNENSSQNNGVETFELGNATRPAWPQAQAGEFITQANHGSKASNNGDAESQNSHVQRSEIWEHAKITQTSEIV